MRILSASLCFALLPALVVANADQPIDFSNDIAPIFQDHCIRCHRADDPKGDVSLATIADLKENQSIVAGDPDSSPIMELITATGGKRPSMPKEGDPLNDRQVGLIRQWILQGGQWPDRVVVAPKAKADASWWSLQPIAMVEPPDRDEANPIDCFVRARLDELGLAPSPQAERRTLIRRLYFDLIGLPPTPDAIKRFLDDSSPSAYEKLVDRLLASKHFGERWARHWLDIAHYADTHGFERDKLRENAWRYRDYVIRSLNEDKPYDQFLREQIAGDVLAPDDPESVIATGFLAAGPWDFVGQVETKSPVLRRAARALDLDDMVTQVMTATVAMTVNCARCHDHKLDPITQKEYYQLTAVFAGLKREDRDISSDHRKQYDAQRQRLEESIRRIGSDIGRLQGEAIDLADVVGGGNGYGSGRKGIGLDSRTGKLQERPFGDLGNVKPGNYAECEYSYVDGVFVPAADTTKVSSTGLVATGLPSHSGKAWDMIRNGPVASQFSTKLGPIDYDDDGHSMIGLHANSGITFDLQAMRAAESSALTFSTVVGYGGRTKNPSAEFWIFLDAQLKASGKLGRDDTSEVNFDIPESARFLTLISTDGGDGYGHDQISFGDPHLRFINAVGEGPVDQPRLAELRLQKERLEQELAQLGPPPAWFGVVAAPPPPVHVLVRGDPESPGEEVEPGTLQWTGTLDRAAAPNSYAGADMAEGDRRVALAHWITGPDNPLTARVIVNRLWHWHFGRGIVGTPSDFGYGGQRPTHPELLDWLAAELVRSGWSQKHIHRLIVTSKTYKMSSAVSADTKASAIDIDNRFLWRMNPRRLEAEAIRDSVLSISGKLNRQMHGPGYRDFEYKEAYAPIYTYKTADSPELWRRSVYRFIVRTTPQQFLTTLDCPDPANLTPSRNVTTTALQSLALFNNDFMLRQSKYFSERLQREAATTGEQIELGFRLAFSRSPRSDELAAARRLVERNGWMHFCRVLFNANEFVYVD